MLLNLGERGSFTNEKIISTVPIFQNVRFAPVVLLFCHCFTQVTSTEERIDVEKLKQHDKIHFYADIMLFEDELHDCGCSILNVKIVSINLSNYDVIN